ncbi:FecR domain-containing protein [Rubrolithibacter danxiaensis]|uniref:FecR family protein n=1 Tax=Rubrolithibacter danxiaensis TaxID=3390805 RepID=UPI003BF84C5C
MKNPQSRIAYLFTNYSNKTATPQEKEELFQLLRGLSDEELTVLLKSEWENMDADDRVFSSNTSKKILHNILKTGNRSSFVSLLLWYKLAAAAAVLIFLSIGLYFFVNTEKKEKQKITEKPFAEDVLPGGNKAILMTADGKTIVLDSQKNGVIANQGNVQINKTRDGQLIFKVAKTAFANKFAGLNTIVTPRGGQYQVVLPDGSKVWLNAATSLRFPGIFKGSSRQVELQGEAYFEVAKNPAMPFIVQSSSAEVRVLGTHFNVKSYEDESVMKTTLLEGAVQLSNAAFSGILKPGEQALLNSKGEVKITDNIDIYDEIAWKNGLFQFNDADIAEIMRQLSRWYDVDISYRGGIPEKRFTGRISRNVNASEILNMLKYTGVNSRIEGRNIVIMN